jgi:hydroxymethylglutaryl-CoA reductase
MVAWPRWVTALLYNGLGRYSEAQEAAQLAADDPASAMFAAWALAELVEAAVRSGDMRAAGAALDRLADSARVADTD